MHTDTGSLPKTWTFEAGWKETGGKTMRLKETGGKETGAKAMGGKATGGKASGAKAPWNEDTRSAK